MAHAVTPFISGYSWSSGFGTKYANPASLATGDGRGVAVNPISNNITLAHITTPFTSAYPLI
jgi:hypothetical protein